MEELITKIGTGMTMLSHNLDRNVHHGSKAAGVRARKITLELERLFKEYRKESLKAAKK